MFQKHLLKIKKSIILVYIYKKKSIILAGVKITSL